MFRTLSFILGHPIARRHPLRAMMRFLRWQIGSRVLVHPVVVPFTDRARLLVSRGMTGATGNIYCGLHEFADMAFVTHLLRPNDLFVDIGANVGVYTILACAVAGSRGIAIEPVPATFKRLIDNVCLNHIQHRTTCCNIALGEQPGIVRFTSARDTTNHVVAANEGVSDAIEVAVSTLDSIAAAESPYCIKCDVEGFETAVVNGGDRTFGNPALQAVILELNGSGERYGYSEASLHERLQGYGFASYTYDPFFRSLRSLEGRNNSSGNTLYVRSPTPILERLKEAVPIVVDGETI
jgi:FkbM family methyltransferase